MTPGGTSPALGTRQGFSSCRASIYRDRKHKFPKWVSGTDGERGILLVYLAAVSMISSHLGYRTIMALVQYIYCILKARTLTPEDVFPKLVFRCAIKKLC